MAGGFVRKYLVLLFSLLAFVSCNRINMWEEFWYLQNGGRPLEGDLSITADAIPSGAAIPVGATLRAAYTGSEKVQYAWRLGDTEKAAGKTCTTDEAGWYVVTVTAENRRPKTASVYVVEDSSGSAASTGSDASENSTSENSTNSAASIGVSLPDITGSVTITGNPWVEGTLTYTYTGGNAGNAVLTWQWKRDGENIEGATGAAYTVVLADLDCALTLDVGSIEHTGVLTSAAVTIVPRNAQQPSITTQPADTPCGVEDTVTLTVAALAADGGTLSYQWYSDTTGSNMDGTILPGETGSSYTPSTAAAGTLYYYVLVTNTIPDNADGGTKTAMCASNAAGVTVLTPDGSAGSPFLIYTEAHLLAISKNTIGSPDDGQWTLDKHYKQMANITLTANWTPIGSPHGDDFVGSYDGSGYTITGLTVNVNSSENYAGMFGLIGAGGEVKNLGLINVHITGSGSNTGGVAGECLGTVSNCSTTGSVTGNSNTGGVVGNLAGEIFSCYSAANVSGTGRVGGIVGWGAAGSKVSNCYTTGSVTGSGSDVGGVAGHLNSNSSAHSWVSNCYSTAVVTGGGSVGGIAGLCPLSSSHVSGCMALNQSLTVTDASSPFFGRVGGSLSGGYSGNHAWEGMQIIDADIVHAAGSQGFDLSVPDAKKKDTWTDAGFQFGADETAPWVWEPGKMPFLRNGAVGLEWPAWLQ